MRDPRRLRRDGDGELARALREAGEPGSHERVQAAWRKLQPALERVPAAGIASGEPDGAGCRTGSGSTSATLIKVGALAGGIALLAAVPWLRAGRDAASERPAAESKPAASAPARISAPAPQAAEPPPAPQPPQDRTPPRTARPRRQLGDGSRNLGFAGARPAGARNRDSENRPLAAAPIDPEAELALLTRAEQQMDVAPAVALQVLAEHERRFADGLLVQEREVLRIDAERALGRSAQAAARAEAFIARFPRSPQRERLAAWLSTRAQQEQPAAEASKP